MNYNPPKCIRNDDKSNLRQRVTLRQVNRTTHPHRKSEYFLNFPSNVITQTPKVMKENASDFPTVKSDNSGKVMRRYKSTMNWMGSRRSHGRCFSSTALYSTNFGICILLFGMAVLRVMDVTEAVPHDCLLPTSWRSEWFHSGAQKPVVVDATSISHKGECVQNLKDRYLLKDRYYGCYRCLVIHQKHENVLQYKETYCAKSNRLETVCRLLSGDAQLHSMFRSSAKPVPCPFPHTYTFTYNRGHGKCAVPKSTVFSCTEDWRLLFRYQACPDVQGTESTTEELVCLGVWKEGSNRYMVGKSDHPLATSDEDRYRCFVYDSWERMGESGFQVAQSGDATCNGLFSVHDGSRTLKLTKVDTSGSRCRFPGWVVDSHWKSLDATTSLRVTHKNTTLKLNGHSVMDGPATLECLELSQKDHLSAAYVTRVTHGCNSGYQCVHLLNRDSHVLEVIMGKVTLRQNEACSNHFFNRSSTNFTTFISTKAESRSCPGAGRYEVLPGSDPLPGFGFDVSARDTIDAPSKSCTDEFFTALTVGCTSSDTLEIQTSCSNSEYSCHGWWEEDGRQYLVVTPTSRSSKGVRRLCLVMDKRKDGAALLASSAHSCSRELKPDMHGKIFLNTTSIERCGPLTASGSTSSAIRIHSMDTMMFAAVISELCVLTLTHLLQYIHR